jgi:hypothetical protein
MAMDLRTETCITLAAVARMLPPGRAGKPITISCVLKWIIDGVKTPAGQVRLEAVRVGGRWITSVEAVERFAARQTPELACERKEVPTP